MNLHLNTTEYNSQEIAAQILNVIKSKPDALICIAGGDSPLPVIEILVNTILKENINTSKLNFIGLDEWLGVSKDNPASCRYYLDTHLFHPLGIKESQIIFFNNYDNIETQIINTNSYLDTKNIDVLLLGVGVNGHLGFNEPNTDINIKTHISNLDSSTQDVGTKYFNNETTPTKGITLGLKHLLQAKQILVVANT